MTSLTPSMLAAFHRRLQRWYRSHGRRDLPWRNTDDPYAIYISEIMLQQTQVETVRTRYYAPFLKRFPTLSVLARAQPEDVLSAWQGLGYYSRALNVHKTAQSCAGKLPQTVEELITLPGIGRNTAHAVAAFAYRHPVPVMEANVKRILCRIFAMPVPSQNDLWEKAQMLLNPRDPFDYNQAMMDIGAMICTPRAPKCSECPANTVCAGKNNPLAYPAPKSKKQVPVRSRHIMVEMDRQGKFHASPRTTRFLQGMYHFTEQDMPPSVPARHIGKVRQVYSHFILEADIYLAVSASKPATRNDRYTLQQLHDLPMSMAEKKILRLLEGHGISAA